MHILLTGSTGFIGRTLLPVLERAGHHVHCGASHRSASHGASHITMDFAQDTDPSAWLPRLEGIEAVVNAVGVLRDSRDRPIDAVHRRTPIALFDACAQAGVQRVVQISALGVELNATLYATTKRAADTHLLDLGIRGVLSPAILRPSIVFGHGGTSSAFLMDLARLPVLPLPEAVLRTRVQPVAVHDLAQTIEALLGPALSTEGVIPCVGPEAVTLAGFIASLRMQCDREPARVLRLPELLTRWSARLGDHLPTIPWCSETLALLSSDNVAEPAMLRRLLGREALHYRQLVEAAWRRVP